MDKMSVLIVDDDEAICNFVSEVLAGEGCLYEIALTAHDALVKMHNNHFDIALLDIRLPDKSGVALLETSQMFFVTTRIIMMSAVNDIDIVIQSMKLGALDYIIKPFTVNKLINSLSETINNRKQRNSLSLSGEQVNSLDQDKNNENRSMAKINAIAVGVDTQVEYYDFHSRIVTERTVNLARNLGLPEKDIIQWESARNQFLTNRQKKLEATIEKLKGMPIAQLKLGLTYSFLDFN